MKSSFLEYVKDIDYPEYSNSSRTNGNHNLDLGLLDLSLGEKDVLGEKLIESSKDAIAALGKYKYAQDPKLLELISHNDKVSSENLAITAGCDGALRVIFQLLSRKLDNNVTIPLPSFGRYEYHAKVNKYKIRFIMTRKFPYKYDYREITKLSISSNSRITILANPNNPTGIYMQKAYIRAILKKIPGYLILDEALINPLVESAVSLVNEFDNLIITRSFSKLYGLAGARIGYVIANKEIINCLKKLISPFEVSSFSLAVATKLLDDKRYINGSFYTLDTALRLLHNTTNSNIQITPSMASTVIIKYKGVENLYKLLLSYKVNTVNGNEFRGLDNENCVRVSIKGVKTIKKLIQIIDRL